MHMLSELQVSSGTRLLLKTVGIQFLSTANKEGLLEWNDFTRADGKRGVIDKPLQMFVWYGRQQWCPPASLYVLPEYWQAAEMIQLPKMGKAKLALGSYHRYMCHLVALTGVKDKQKANAAGPMPKVSWSPNEHRVSFSAWASLLCWEPPGAFAGSGRRGITAMKSFCKLGWRRVTNPPTPEH